MNRTLASWVLSYVLRNQATLPQEEPAKPQPSQAPAHLEVAGNKISVYGILRMDAYWGDARLNHTQFPYYALSHDSTVTPGIDEDDDWIDFTPRLSRLGVRVTRESLPFWEEAKVLGFLEFDFQNRATSEVSGLESESRELPRLRHAYVRLAAGSFSVLVGQTWDLISPLWPGANADGMMWNAGNLGDRRPQIRLGWEEKAFDGTLNASFALARTGAIDRKNLDGPADSMRDGDDSGLPMLQGRISMSSWLDKRIDFGVWGHFGWEEVQVDVAGEDEFATSSIGMDLKIRLLDSLSLAAEAWRGKNLSDLRGGIDQGVNAATGEEIRAAGGWVELVWTLSAVVTLAGGIALDDPKDNDLTVATQRSRNLALYLWSRFDLGGGLGFGLEWIRWETDYLNVDEGAANRFNLFATYSF